MSPVIFKHLAGENSYSNGSIFIFYWFSETFPKNRSFTEYQLNHLDNNVVSEVSGVSRSCMVIKSQLIKEIGMFDREIFCLSGRFRFCLRAKYHGWTICFFLW